MAVSKIHGNIDTGWKAIGGSWTGATRKHRVKNGICYIAVATFNGDANPTFTAGQWAVVGILPEGARPTETIYGSCANRAGVTAEVQIATDGKININASQNTKNIAVNICFPI